MEPGEKSTHRIFLVFLMRVVIHTPIGQYVEIA